MLLLYFVSNKCRLGDGEQKRILKKNIKNLTVQKLLTDNVCVSIYILTEKHRIVDIFADLLKKKN